MIAYLAVDPVDGHVYGHSTEDPVGALTRARVHLHDLFKRHVGPMDHALLERLQVVEVRGDDRSTVDLVVAALAKADPDLGDVRRAVRPTVRFVLAVDQDGDVRGFGPNAARAAADARLRSRAIAASSAETEQRLEPGDVATVKVDMYGEPQLIRRLRAARGLAPQVTRIDELELSIRSMNCLQNAGIDTVDELCKWRAADILGLRNANQRVVEDIEAELRVIGRSLKAE